MYLKRFSASPAITAIQVKIREIKFPTLIGKEAKIEQAAIGAEDVGGAAAQA